MWTSGGRASESGAKASALRADRTRQLLGTAPIYMDTAGAKVNQFSLVMFMLTLSKSRPPNLFSLGNRPVSTPQPPPHFQRNEEGESIRDRRARSGGEPCGDSQAIEGTGKHLKRVTI